MSNLFIAAGMFSMVFAVAVLVHDNDSVRGSMNMIRESAVEAMRNMLDAFEDISEACGKIEKRMNEIEKRLEELEREKDDGK